MPRLPHRPLTEVAIRNAKPREKHYRLTDAKGLYLEVAPSGGKWWRLKFSFGGGENRISLGVYPDVSLAQAREKRDQQRALLAQGISPSQHRKATKAATADRAANSFEVIAREWIGQRSDAWVEAHTKRNVARFEGHVFPYLGTTPIADIRPRDVLGVLRRIEETGHIETAHRVAQLISQVIRYAIRTERCDQNPAADLGEALKAPSERHHPAITDPKEFGAFLRVLDGYGGTAVVRLALKFASLVFQRPGEIRAARWDEIDLDGGLWTIPAARMKGSKASKDNGSGHLVPLSRQAVELLRELRLLTGMREHVFPSARGGGRPMSDMALSAAMKAIGYQGRMSAHGFRASARTLIDEHLHVRPEVIEAQLAHTVRDPLGRAYNRTTFIQERRQMMQRWADYLDVLRAEPRKPPQLQGETA